MLGKICVVRTYSAGVFFGKVVERDGKEVRMTDARRLWYWDGAASLSQLANDGVSKPENCKFPAPVAEIVLTEAITSAARPATDPARSRTAASTARSCPRRS